MPLSSGRSHCSDFFHLPSATIIMIMLASQKILRLQHKHCNWLCHDCKPRLQTHASPSLDQTALELLLRIRLTQSTCLNHCINPQYRPLSRSSMRVLYILYSSGHERCCISMYWYREINSRGFSVGCNKCFYIFSREIPYNITCSIARGKTYTFTEITRIVFAVIEY